MWWCEQCYFLCFMPNTEDMRHLGYITTNTFLFLPDLYGLCFLSFLLHHFNRQKCAYYTLCCHPGSWRGPWPLTQNSHTDNYSLDYLSQKQQYLDMVVSIVVVVHGFVLLVYLLFFCSLRLSWCFGGCVTTILFLYCFFPSFVLL